MSSPFGKKTPESHFSGLRRKDSKNALTHCHGVTSSGRACRRALASPKNSSKFDGVVVFTENDGDPAVFFCWQHQHQAEPACTDDGSIVELKGRHSLEEAFRSLGLEDVREVDEVEDSGRDVRLPEPEHTVAIDFGQRKEKNGRSPVAVPEEMYRSSRSRRRSHRLREDVPESPPPKPRIKRTTTNRSRRDGKSSVWSLLFSSCLGGQEISRKAIRNTNAPRDEGPRIAKSTSGPSHYHHHEMVQASKAATGRNHNSEPPYYQLKDSQSPKVRRKELPSRRKRDLGVDAGQKDSSSPWRMSDGEHTSHHREDPRSNRPRLQIYRDAVSERTPQNTYLEPYFANSELVHPASQQRPLNQRSKSTPDSQQLNRIHGEWPPSLPRNATDSTRIAYAKLLTAMSEPPTKGDQAGYIYIFWQTDTDQTDDETSAVASIINAPADRGLQRQETILQRRFFQTSANARLPRPAERRTIFLKVGRAANVHQRLNQWKKQCEYAITLLRSYPYDPRGHEVARKVVYVGKVERLIHLHLEMLGQRVKKQCRCGTEHKEWFEVDANTTAVRVVDGIVRKWVQWSEDRFTGSIG
jgi:hypothetical protein